MFFKSSRIFAPRGGDTQGHNTHTAIAVRERNNTDKAREPARDLFGGFRENILRKDSQNPASDWHGGCVVRGWSAWALVESGSKVRSSTDRSAEDMS